MKFRVIVAVPVVLSLSSCGIFGLDRPDGPPAPSVSQSPRMAAPVAEAAAPDPWCLAVATNDKNRAAGNGFDAPTQQRIFTTSYTQCVAIFGGAR